MRRDMTTRPHTAERQNSDTRSHLTLHVQRDIENEVLDLLNRTSLDDLALILLGARGQVTECRDSVTLDFLVLFKGEKLDERVEEASLDDWGFVLRVDRHVSDTGGGGENEW